MCWADPWFITREAKVGTSPEAAPFMESGSCVSRDLAVETHIKARGGEKPDCFDLAVLT